MAFQVSEHRGRAIVYLCGVALIAAGGWIGLGAWAGLALVGLGLIVGTTVGAKA
jgi:hypothetical protein